MRFVAVKSEEQQAAAMVFRVRDLVVRQRTQTINAIRGHLAEFGLVAAQGLFHVAKLVAAIGDKGSSIPEAARPILYLLVDQFRSLDERVAVLDREIARRAPRHRANYRDRSCGVGSFSGNLQERARLCRVARPNSAATVLRRKAKARGDVADGRANLLRRLLIIGASAAVRWAMRKGATADPWLSRMLSRKPPMLVIVALANKTGRIVWALMAKGGTYRSPTMAG